MQTALASGLPFVGIPLQPEQDANVVFAERQGAARRVTTREAGTRSVADAARKLLTEPSYRARAQDLQAIFAAVDGRRPPPTRS